MKAKGNYTTISLPAPLVEKIESRIENTGFNSVSSYVTYILRQVMSSIEQDQAGNQKAFSKKDEEEVKARLKGLGYLE